MSDRQEKGTVEEEVGPRSYIIGTPSGSYRRNRRSIVPLPSPQRDPPNSPRPLPNVPYHHHHRYAEVLESPISPIVSIRAPFLGDVL